jgi:MFS family permease
VLSFRTRNYTALSAFLFAFFFAQAMAMSLLSIWLTRSLDLNGAQAGTVFAVNSLGAMLAQPAYGYLSDRMGFRKVVPVMIASLVILAGPFFLYVYAPLLRWSLPLGAVVGGIYLGFTFMAAMRSKAMSIGWGVAMTSNIAGRASGVRWGSPPLPPFPGDSTISTPPSTSSSRAWRASPCSPLFTWRRWSLIPTRSGRPTN